MTLSRIIYASIICATLITFVILLNSKVDTFVEQLTNLG